MSDTNAEVNVTEENGSNPLLNDVWYKRVEFTARVILPALAILVGALGTIWGLDDATKYAATIVALDVFLGVFVGVAQRSYDKSDAKYDGTVTATPTPDGNAALSNLVLNQDPTGAEKLVLKVESPST